MNKTINKKYLYCTYLICIFFFISCDHSNNQEFTIFYFCGDVEANVPFECDELDSLCKTAEYDDTIYIDSDMTEQICNAIKTANPTDENHSQYPVMCVNVGDFWVCLNKSNNLCWVKENDKRYHLSIISNKVVYILKWISKYYNYLPYDVLELDKGIQQYGVPSDYKEEQINETEPKKESSKVLVRVR